MQTSIMLLIASLGAILVLLMQPVRATRGQINS